MAAWEGLNSQAKECRWLLQVGHGLLLVASKEMKTLALWLKGIGFCQLPGGTKKQTLPCMLQKEVKPCGYLDVSLGKTDSRENSDQKSSKSTNLCSFQQLASGSFVCSSKRKWIHSPTFIKLSFSLSMKEFFTSPSLVPINPHFLIYKCDFKKWSFGKSLVWLQVRVFLANSSHWLWI